MGKVSEFGRRAGAMHGALDRLRAMIVLGELSPGEQIRQQDMADALGVSRVPLREAMNILADQGLLVHHRNSGYFVARRPAGSVAQIRRMLYLLENELIATIDWPEAEPLEQLRTLNQEVEVAVRGNDLQRVSDSNRNFHLALYRLSPHSLVHQEVERLWARLDPVFSAKMTRPEYIQRMVEEHALIIQALAGRDRAALRRVIDQHRYGQGPVPALTPPEASGD
ncbi:MAG: GntR family transcriptional regulator [Pigmentiphaga sp.]|nr:GntR family transcriptional regulator [Pigmentiphaga sp.]